MKKADTKRSVLPTIIFGILFAVSITIFSFWYNQERVAMTFQIDIYIKLAIIFIYPLIITLGTAFLLYIVELLGVIKTKRSKTVSVVLIVIISVLMICSLVGTMYTEIIDIYSLYFLLDSHNLKYIEIIVYVLMGLGLFLSIGQKQIDDNVVVEELKLGDDRRDNEE